MNFPLRLVTCFPTFHVFLSVTRTGYIFSNTRLGLHVFLCLILVTYFPTHDLAYMLSMLDTGYIFSHTDFAYMFSCAWHWFHVFPDMTRLTLFPMLGTTWLQYNTIQYNTMQYNAIRQYTIQYNTSLLYNTLSFRCGVTWNDTPASLQVFHINQ